MCVQALQHLFDIISRFSASKGVFKEMSVAINTLHAPIQTVCLYRYHSVHWYITIQGLWDKSCILEKESSFTQDMNGIHRQGEAWRYVKFVKRGCKRFPQFSLKPTTPQISYSVRGENWCALWQTSKTAKKTTTPKQKRRWSNLTILQVQDMLSIWGQWWGLHFKKQE